MKKKLLLIFCVGMIAASQIYAQNKNLYVDSMYPRSSINVTQGITYQMNIGVITGGPQMETLKLDLYQPSQNTSNARPLVIFLHTGSYLPRYTNGTPTGARDDSATVEFCTQIAQRGYVVAAVTYRVGWNPYLPTEDERKSSIINAAYKSVQDVSAAVRFFKKSVYDGNAYKIDSTKIAIGGQGTGSYAMYAYSAITSQQEIRIAKFFDFTKMEPMVDDTLWGDRMGFKIPGAPFTLAQENHKQHTSDAQVGFAIGGCMGDSGWIKAGQIPLVSVHPVKDPFAPYTTGLVRVPLPPTYPPVVSVSGGHDVMQIVNRVKNNACYADSSKTWVDPYSTNARQYSPNIEGLYSVQGKTSEASGPWEWWMDSADLDAWLMDPSKHPGDTFQQAQVTAIIQGGQASNPTMSKAKALKYIDTTLGYIIPRIACCLDLWNCPAGPSGKIHSLVTSANVSIRPNPTSGVIQVKNTLTSNNLKGLTICDINGRILSEHQVANNEIYLNLNLKPGLYFVQLQFEHGATAEKLMIQ